MDPKLVRDEFTRLDLPTCGTSLSARVSAWAGASLPEQDSTNKRKSNSTTGTSPCWPGSRTPCMRPPRRGPHHRPGRVRQCQCPARHGSDLLQGSVRHVDRSGRDAYFRYEPGVPASAGVPGTRGAIGASSRTATPSGWSTRRPSQSSPVRRSRAVPGRRNSVGLDL